MSGDPEMVVREAMDLVGIETRASNDDPQPIGALWGRAFAENPFRDVDALDDVLVAVYCEYEGDHTKPYTFFLGCRVAPGSKVPEGLARRRIDGGSFARFVAEGEQPQSIIETWGRIWNAPIERAYRADYELHPLGGGTRVEIFVGV